MSQTLTEIPLIMIVVTVRSAAPRWCTKHIQNATLQGFCIGCIAEFHRQNAHRNVLGEKQK